MVNCSLYPAFQLGGFSDLWGAGGFTTRLNAINITGNEEKRKVTFSLLLGFSVA